MISKAKNECPTTAATTSECDSSDFCIKWWMAAAGAAGSSILTLIIVILSIWIYFKCCTKEKRSKRKSSKKQQKIVVSDRPPGDAVLDLSDKNDRKTSPPHTKRRKKRSYTPTSIYDVKRSFETETPNANPSPKLGKKNVQISGEKMEEIFEPKDLNSRECIQRPQTPARTKPSNPSTIDLLKSDLFDRPSPNVYPKK